MLKEVHAPIGCMIGECGVLIVDEKVVGVATTSKHEQVVIAVVVEIACDSPAGHDAVASAGRDETQRVLESCLVCVFGVGNRGLGACE